MPEFSPDRPIRRVLVALDASPGSRDAARAAAHLASRLDAELAGLFVEDQRLLALCASEMALQAYFLTASTAPVRSRDLERLFRSQASRARAVLSTTAHAAGVGWSFRVVRGEVCDAIRDATGEEDLVSLGEFGWSLRHKGPMGRIARALLSEANRHTMLTGRGVEIHLPVVALYGSSEPGQVAVRLGARLAGDREGSLLVLLLGEDPERLRAEATRLVADREFLPSFVSVGEISGSGIARAIHAHHGGLVVLPVSSPHLAQEHVQSLLEQVGCPVLAVS